MCVPASHCVQGTDSQNSPAPFPSSGEEESYDRRVTGSDLIDPPPEIPVLRRETHADCEVRSCRATREEYGIGYTCWRCGHVQHSHCGFLGPKAAEEGGLLLFNEPQTGLARWALEEEED